MSHLDEEFPSIHKSLFHIPNKTYLCGNSLGLQPKSLESLLLQELVVWKERGVEGHFDHPHGREWALIDDCLIPQMAKIVGAIPHEVAICNSLTVNLHLLMVSFYRPSSKRTKIIMESKAFPSDFFMIESQVKFHGLDPSDTIIQIEPKAGSYNLETQDIINAIKLHGDSLALVLFSGVQYYTGQLFDIKQITKAGHDVGAYVGWDLAHAVGNVELNLHEWNVDFAAWCTYKYLNSGPGNIGGLFLNEKHAQNDFSKFHGWWGTAPETKFKMDLKFKPVYGANQYRISNPCVLSCIALLASLQVFETTSMQELCARSCLLTGHLEALVNSLGTSKFVIITPRKVDARGCQISIKFFDDNEMVKVFTGLEKAGVVCDERKPDVIRVSPTPLYNTFADINVFFEVFSQLLKELD